MKTLKSKNQGFSLLELLLYIAILSVISVVLATAFISLNKGRAQAEARIEVNSNIRFVVERITQDINDASSVTLPILGSPSSSLSLIVGGQSVVYSVSSGVLQRTFGTNPSESITSSSVIADPPTFTMIQNFNSVLVATTTNIQTILNIKYNSASPDWNYSTNIKSSASLR